jgi:hypothetical protein
MQSVRGNDLTGLDPDCADVLLSRSQKAFVSKHSRSARFKVHGFLFDYSKYVSAYPMDALSGAIAKYCGGQFLLYATEVSEAKKRTH